MLTWRQVFAWRLRRHLLEPIGELGATEVVERLCGVQAQVPSAAELAVRVRRQHSGAGEVDGALADGRLIRTWAMRGTLHLLEPRQGGAFLALIAAARPWDRPSWQRYFRLSSEGVDTLRDAVAVALDGKALTREELISTIAGQPGLDEISDGLRSGWSMLLKPLAWQGELCHGPSQGSRVTFMRPADASPAWAGLPDIETAARRAVTAYLGVHGPATPGRFGQWLAGSYFGTRTLRDWFSSLGEAICEVEVDGEAMWALSSDVPDLVAIEPTSTIRLLPAFDQWVLAPGTADGRIIPTARRHLVSRTAGWISPIVLAGGVVVATWELDDHVVRVGWFDESGKVPQRGLHAEVARLAGILDRDLRLVVEQVPA